MSSMAAPALQKCLRELSAAILHHKEAARDLEKTKGEVQSQLNSILDPMARLPKEISSKIFIHCLPHNVSERTHPSAAPLLLMNVCRSWNKIAISIPALWTAVHIRFPCAEAFEELMQLWLDRALNLPLSIALHGSLDSDVCATVHENAEQVQTLELYLRSADELHEMTTSFPSLKTLTIGRGDPDTDDPDDSDEDSEYPADDPDDEDSFGVVFECVEMLRAAPNLVHCTLHDVDYPREPSQTYGGPEALTHTSLKHLRLDSNSNAFILDHFTLPGLESLRVSSMNFDPCDFLAFLTRSSPPLKSLEMEIPGHGWSGGLAVIFPAIPNVTELELDFSSSSPLSALFDLLSVGSPPQFLPNLSYLRISGLDIDSNRHEYEKLVSMLSARRSCPQQIQTFRIYLQSTKKPEPKPKILTALRQLVADGMDIHIGSIHKNYV